MNKWKIVWVGVLMMAALSVTAWAMVRQEWAAHETQAAGQTQGAKAQAEKDPLEPGPDYTPDP